MTMAMRFSARPATLRTLDPRVTDLQEVPQGFPWIRVVVIRSPQSKLINLLISAHLCLDNYANIFFFWSFNLIFFSVLWLYRWKKLKNIAIFSRRLRWWEFIILHRYLSQVYTYSTYICIWTPSILWTMSSNLNHYIF